MATSDRIDMLRRWHAGQTGLHPVQVPAPAAYEGCPHTSLDHVWGQRHHDYNMAAQELRAAATAAESLARACREWADTAEQHYNH